MYPPRSRARLHAPSRKRAWGVQGAVHAFARLHAQEDSRSLTAVKVARRLKPGRSNASRRARYGKVLISSGIWRTISENPHQKMSKYSPNLTKYKHTKRARVQPKRGGDTPPTPPKRRKWPGRGGEGTYPRNRVHACTLCMLPRKRSTREHKTSRNSDRMDRVTPSLPTQYLSAEKRKRARISVGSVGARGFLP